MNVLDYATRHPERVSVPVVLRPAGVGHLTAQTDVNLEFLRAAGFIQQTP